MEQDISQQTASITTPQPEAIHNVQAANALEIPPDTYKESKTDLQSFVEQFNRPVLATPVVANWMSNSSEHAAALAPDVEHLNIAEKIIRDVGQGFKSGLNDPDQERKDLLFEKATSADGKLDPAKEITLRGLNLDAQDNYGIKDYGLSGWEKVPGRFAEGISGFAGMAARNAKLFSSLVAAETGLSALEGAGAGLAVGGVGVVPGALAGAAVGVAKGLGEATLVTGLWDAYKGTTASVYGDLDNMKDKGGNPLNFSHQTKSYIAQGAGIVVGGLQFVGNKILLNTIPGLSNLAGREGVQAAIQDSSIRGALLRIGKTMAETGTIGMAQTLTTNLVHNFSQLNGDYSPQSIAKAITDSLDQNVLQSGVVNAAIGGVVNGTVEALTSKAKTTAQNIRDRNVPSGVERDVTPPEPGLLQAPQKPNNEIVIDDLGPIGPSSDTHNPAPTIQQADEVLKLQDALDASKHVTDQTNVKKLSPEIANDLLAEMFKQNGIDKVWIDKEDMGSFVDAAENEAEKKGRAESLRNLLDPEQISALQNNQPVPMHIRDILDLHDKYQDLSYYVKRSEVGPTPRHVENYVKSLEQQTAKLAQVQAKLAPLAQTPQLRAQNAALNPQSTDEEIANTLGTKEVAQEYLNRLDVNEKAEQGNQEQLANIQAMRERVQTIATQLPDEATANQTYQEAINHLTTKPKNDVFGEADYLNQPKLTEAIKSIFPEKDAPKIDQALQDARKEVADGVANAVQREMNEIDFHRQVEIDAKSKAEELAAKDPKIQVVDKFINTISDDGKMTYQLDPNTLSKEQRRLFGKNDQLKRHKVFRKGSKLSPDEAAQLIGGVQNGDELLNTLSTTKSSKEFIDEFVRQRKAVTADALKDTDLYRTKMAQAYDKLSNAHLKEMKFLKNEKWPVTKKIIKRVAVDTPLPTKNQLASQAQRLIGKTKIGELSYKPFVSGERKSQRQAVDAVLKGDFQKAFNQKRAAALNTELAKEAHVKIGEVNKAIKFFKEVQSSKIQAELVKAGSTFKKAMDEITDVYNFDPKAKNQSERDAVHKWIVEQVGKGNGDFSVLPEYSNIKQNVNEMTVNELLEGYRLGQIILESARYENDLIGAKEKLDKGALIEELTNSLADHPDNDNRKLIDATDRRLQSTGFKITNFIENNHYLAGIKNFESILVTLDKGQVYGKFQETFMPMLKGEGAYRDQGMTLRARFRSEIDQFEDHTIALFNKAEAKQKGLSKLGAKLKDAADINEFHRLYTDVVVVPEWKDNPNFPGGKVTKAQLLSMMYQRGNEHNLQTLCNGHGILKEEVEAVLERELDEKYAEYAQRAMNKFKDLFWPHVVDLETKTTGIIPEMVQATPFTHRNITYPGGYYPVMREPSYNVEQLTKRITGALSFTNDFEPDNFNASEMTRHNHTKARVGGTDRLRLDPAVTAMAMESMAHDLAFRLPLRDATSLLIDPKVRDAIVKATGKESYKLLLGSLKTIGVSQRVADARVFDVGSVYQKLLALNQAVQSTGLLVFNAGSVVIQPLSMVFTSERMGINGQKHLGKVLTAAVNPVMFSKMAEFAAENNASIYEHQSHINESAQNVFRSKIGNKAPTVLKPLNALAKSVNDGGYKILGVVDYFMKVVAFNAGYKQFVAGDAKGFSKEMISKMSPEEVHNHAVGFANRIVTQTLTSGDELDKSSIQHHEFLRFIVPFFNDTRNVINNTLRLARQSKQHSEGAYQSFKEGDFKSGSKKTIYAATTIATMFLISSIANFALDRRYGFKTPSLDGVIDAPDAESRKAALLNYGKEWMNFAATSPLWTSVGDMPGIRDVGFAFQEWTDWGMKTAAPNPLILRPAVNLFETTKLTKDWLDGYELDDKQIKTLMYDFGYITKSPLPVNGLMKFAQAISNVKGKFEMAKFRSEFIASVEAENNGTSIAQQMQNPTSLADEVKARIDKVLVEQEKETNPKEKVDPEILDEVKKLRAQLGK